MDILLLQDDPQVREKLVFVLEGQFNARVMEAGDVAQARSLLKKESQPHLLILDCDRSKTKEIDRLWVDHCAIPSIVVLRGPEDRPLSVASAPGQKAPTYVQRADVAQNVISAIRTLVKDAVVPNPDDDREFCKIRTNLLLSVCPLDADVYIRLSASKYLKLLQKGDHFDLQDMEKYTIKKGVEHLYLRKTSIQAFIQKCRMQIRQYLLQRPLMSLEDAAQQSQAVFESVQEISMSVGLTPEVQELAKAQVQLTVQVIGKTPKLSSILARIEAHRGKYIAAHSSMCAYLACAVASQMQWGSETTFNKLSLAAFLHDITLTNHDLAERQTLDEVKQGPFAEDEKRAYAQHTVSASEMARKFNEVPPDVDSIIAQHHEQPDGKGFPRGLSAPYIAPLAAIFIVAHDLTRFALRTPNFQLAKFLEARREHYRAGQFRKVIQAIEQLDSL